MPRKPHGFTEKQQSKPPRVSEKLIRVIGAIAKQQDWGAVPLHQCTHGGKLTK